MELSVFLIGRLSIRNVAREWYVVSGGNLLVARGSIAGLLAHCVK
jgi:hypothetical protein